jgi:arylsulfatase
MDLAVIMMIFSLPALAEENLDRSILPIQEPSPQKYRELDARNAKAPPLFEVKAPKGAPNVVIVLIDDIGFGGPSTFGGPLQMPTLDRLAKSGLTFNNYNTENSDTDYQTGQEIHLDYMINQFLSETNYR